MHFIGLSSQNLSWLRRGRASQDGISLVEMMVTLSIIALATSLVLLTLPIRPQYKQEAGRLHDALEQMASRANVSGLPMGLVIEDGTYSLAIWQDGNWRVVRSQQLPGDIRVQIDGKPSIPAEDGRPVVPAVIFDPLGHTQPVSIELIRSDVLTSLTLRSDGKVEMEVR